MYSGVEGPDEQKISLIWLYELGFVRTNMLSIGRIMICSDGMAICSDKEVICSDELRFVRTNKYSKNDSLFLTCAEFI